MRADAFLFFQSAWYGFADILQFNCNTSAQAIIFRFSRKTRYSPTGTLSIANGRTQSAHLWKFDIEEIRGPVAAG
jgi:hypothetical protein